MLVNRAQEPRQIARLTDFLLHFQHSKALDEALRLGGRSDDAVSAAAPFAVVAVVRELSRRGTLAAAVSGQTVNGLTRILRFIRQKGWRPYAIPTGLLLFKIITSECDL